MGRRAMKPTELRELLGHISTHHRFGHSGKRIKYVQPVFDMRSGDIHCVIISGSHDKTFSITNENRDRDLKEWIYEWLESEENGYFSHGGTWVENIPDDEQWLGA